MRKLTKIFTTALLLLAFIAIPASAVTVTPGAAATPNYINAQFYVLSTSSNVPTRTSLTGADNGYIAPGDLCTVKETTNSTYWKVEYPVSGGKKQAYVRKDAILKNVSFAPQSLKVAANTTVYRRENMSQSFGTTYTTDTIRLLSPIQNGKAQIIYNISGGWKIGWIYAETIPVGTNSTWTNPMNNMSITCDWGYKSSLASRVTRPYHIGVDMISTDKSILAVSDGTIKYAKYSGDNGNMIVIEHSSPAGTVYSYYSHLSSFTRTSGTVKKGEKIGVMGGTGNVSGDHLHFMITNKYSTAPYGWGSVYNTGLSKVTFNSTVYYNPLNFIKNNGKV